MSERGQGLPPGVSPRPLLAGGGGELLGGAEHDRPPHHADAQEDQSGETVQPPVVERHERDTEAGHDGAGQRSPVVADAECVQAG